jgi:hypothetical protein
MNPVVMIFAREVSDPLTSLVKKIDKATADNKEKRMGSFIVFLSDDEALEAKLKDLIKSDKIDHTVVTIENDVAGPKAYKVAKDADVTVVLYNKRDVKANYAFKKGEMSDKDVDKIVKDVSKILPDKDSE